jgi:EAL domain-containing protein (putative c-di-GMP-specific phosphodiesterase class I)
MHSINYSCDYLKIDGRLINRVHESIKGEKILENIINFGHSLKIKMIAESVEFEDELVLLKKLKCDLIQGYLFSRPLTLKNYILFYTNNNEIY